MLCGGVFGFGPSIDLWRVGFRCWQLLIVCCDPWSGVVAVCLAVFAVVPATYAMLCLAAVYCDTIGRFWKECFVRCEERSNGYVGTSLLKSIPG